MNHQTVSTDLSFGQLFLFQQKARQRPLFYPPRLRLRTLRLSIRIAALAGVLLGFSASVLLQILLLLAFH